jgi:hypothetical protein
MTRVLVSETLRLRSGGEAGLRPRAIYADLLLPDSSSGEREGCFTSFYTSVWTWEIILARGSRCGAASVARQCGDSVLVPVASAARAWRSSEVEVRRFGVELEPHSVGVGPTLQIGLPACTGGSLIRAVVWFVRLRRYDHPVSGLV